ncbi:alkylmercury lyase family protein [Streptomyces sp. NPDC001709]
MLAELAGEDFLSLDADGRIAAAYPFSATPTPHRVVIDGTVQAWSMCAIDALGMSAMLGKDVVIHSSDPITGDPVTVTNRDGRAVWQPAGAVVGVGRRSCPGPAAEVCCDALNFFTSAATAHAWLQAHPEVRGQIIGQKRAEAIGRQIFGPLPAGNQPV